jgi:phosphatidate cytidylyltransferase
MTESPRFLSALVLSLFALFVIIWVNSLGVELVYGLVIGLAAYEWSQLVPLGRTQGYGFVLLTIAGLLVVVLIPPIGRFLIIPLVTLFWLLSPLLIFGRERNRPGPLWTVLVGWLVLVGAWYALVALSWKQGPPHWLLLSFLLLVWGADSGAYVAGRCWGRHGLALAVSPNKTWEGVWGAGVAIGLVLIFMHFLMKVSLFTLLPLGFLVWYFSILGDLFESRLKRWQGVKDSGRIIPGHGGVLDRIDSWTAAAPVFLLFWNWFVR